MECLKHSVNGNELWSVWEKKDGTRAIILFLLASKDGRWGYKEIAEVSGPYYYKCPLKFLDMAAIANTSWREKVLELHARKAKAKSLTKKLKIGMVAALDIPDNEFRVTKLNPLMGVSLKENKLYRLVKSRIISVRPGDIAAIF